MTQMTRPMPATDEERAEYEAQQRTPVQEFGDLFKKGGKQKKSQGGLPWAENRRLASGKKGLSPNIEDVFRIAKEDDRHILESDANEALEMAEQFASYEQSDVLEQHVLDALDAVYELYGAWPQHWRDY